MKYPKNHTLVLLLLAATTSSAWAGMITDIRFEGPGGTGTAVRQPGFAYSVNKTFTKMESIDIVFDVINRPDVLRSYEFTETIVNSTGKSWFDFHMVLGYGTGTNFVPIDDLFSRLIFTSHTLPIECTPPTPCPTTPPYDTPFMSAGRPSGAGRTFLDYVTTSSDITAPNAQAVENNHRLMTGFDIQIPNGITQFTLRQTPTSDGMKYAPPATVALPNTLYLLLLGLVGLVVTRPRRSGLAPPLGNRHLPCAP